MQIVKVLKSFNKTPQGGLVDVGDMIEVDDVRADELVRNGLVQRAGAAEKAAPEPDNKMAPEHADKARRALVRK